MVGFLRTCHDRLCLDVRFMLVCVCVCERESEFSIRRSFDKISICNTMSGGHGSGGVGCPTPSYPYT